MVLPDKNCHSKLIPYKIILSVLSKRYNECNLEGHKKPFEERNLCCYCYRHLKYNSPETDLLLISRKDMPFLFQPLDAPFLDKRRKEEIESQKSLDLMNGIASLVEELRIV